MSCDLVDDDATGEMAALKPRYRNVSGLFFSIIGSYRSLALLFECKVGKGKLLVSGIDLASDIEAGPEAKQMLFSLEKYMSSSEFNPKIEVDPNKLSDMLNVNNRS